ncbi:MAG: nuclear transport factor 2 family protein [Saprospiraceae bacterium]
MMSNSPEQATEATFAAHLERRKHSKTEEDIRENYHPDVVLLTSNGIFKGHDGVRQSAKLLADQLPDLELSYKTQYVSGEVAFLEWTGKSHAGEVHDGTDTFLIRDGKILVQTIHYTVTRHYFH